jgi:RHS repeat-associated protein
MKLTVGTAVTRYIYDGDRVLEETSDGGTVQARYTTASGSYYAPLLHLWRVTGESRFPMYDLTGSVRGLLDAAGGVTDTYTLEAFGKQRSSTGTTPNPYRYGAAWGYITDPSGFLQLGARYYWPEVGRFVSQDPIGYARNWYAYAPGNPVIWFDPEGLWYWWLHRNWSKTAALNAGMCSTDATAAGRGGADADTLYIGSVGSAPHFDQPGYTLEQYAADYRKMAVELWLNGDHEGAAYILGMGAHAIQDSYTHPRGILGPLKHRGHHDDPCKHPEAARKAQEATKEHFRSFMAEVSQ